MSFGKINTFIDILEIQKAEDEDGYDTETEVVVASVRAYREGRHGSKKWANMAVYSEATELFDGLNEEITVVAELVKACVRENASTAQSQEEYAKKYNGLLARYDKATARVAELTTEKERKHNQDREIRLFTEALKKQPLVLEEWDERLWVAILDRATVFRDGRIVFKFKSGSEIEVER